MFVATSFSRKKKTNYRLFGKENVPSAAVGKEYRGNRVLGHKGLIIIDLLERVKKSW